jgi:hypothetical protein
MAPPLTAPWAVGDMSVQPIANVETSTKTESTAMALFISILLNVVFGDV